MEFSYSLTMQDAREAFRLYYWRLRAKLAIGFMCLLLAADLAVMVLMVANNLGAGLGVLESVTAESMGTLWILFGIVLFFLVYALVLLPWIALKPIRKNPKLLAVRKASVTAEGLRVEAEFGSSQMNWAMYEFWREGKGVIILKMVSGQYGAISKSDLSEPQLKELRGILTAALPLKK